MFDLIFMPICHPLSDFALIGEDEMEGLTYLLIQNISLLPQSDNLKDLTRLGGRNIGYKQFWKNDTEDLSIDEIGTVRQNIRYQMQ